MKKDDVSKGLGQWLEFAKKFEKAGGMYMHLQKVIDSKNNELAMKIIRFIEQTEKIMHLIPTHETPFCENGSKIVSHNHFGDVIFHPEDFDTYVTRVQNENKFSYGIDLMEALKDEPTANATFLDYLLAYPHLIQDCWFSEPSGVVSKLVYIIFWGTIYEDNAGKYVRWLSKENGKITTGTKTISKMNGGDTFSWNNRALVYVNKM